MDPLQHGDAGGVEVPSGFELSVTAESLTGAPPGDASCISFGEHSEYTEDADCTAQPNGSGNVEGPCNCGGCLSNVDCGNGEYCDVLAGGSCMPMSCRRVFLTGAPIAEPGARRFVIRVCVLSFRTHQPQIDADLVKTITDPRG